MRHFPLFCRHCKKTFDVCKDAYKDIRVTRELCALECTIEKMSHRCDKMPAGAAPHMPVGAAPHMPVGAAPQHIRA